MVHDKKKIHVIYDPPHLLKNIRNNLKKGNLAYDNQIVRWQYIEEFYRKDKENSIRLAPKLTDKHVELPPFSAMKVNLAAQILSHSVAAGINTLANLGFFPPDACVTAEFVETFDQLFNCFNSGSNKSTQKYRNPFSDNSGHKAFLETCLKFLAKIKTESGNNLPCINGWQISIKALFNLWEDLQTCGFKYLLTNRVNQDSLECLFSIIRGRCGSRDNPDPQQFRAAFRHVVIKKLFVQSQLSNCEFDTNKILLDIASIAIYQKKQKPTVSVENPEVTDILRIANPPLSLPVQNVAAYVSGYLLRKFPVDNCEQCLKEFQISNKPENSTHSKFEFIRNKNYKTTECLMIPSMAFFHFC